MPKKKNKNKNEGPSGPSLKQGALRLVDRKGHSAFSFLLPREAGPLLLIFPLLIFHIKIMIYEDLTVQFQIRLR
jgi:hypothetical protein